MTYIANTQRIVGRKEGIKPSEDGRGRVHLKDLGIITLITCITTGVHGDTRSIYLFMDVNNFNTL